MDIELHGDSGNGRSPDGYRSQSLTDRLHFGLSQPCDDTGGPSTEALLVRELLQCIHDLRARIECLENRLSAPHQAGPAFDTNVDPEPTQDEFADLDDVADAEAPHTEQGSGGLRLDDLPRGPLSIDVVAKAIGKTVRTLRGWCQIEKYEIPAHKEAGHWRFYKDELTTWHADYEAISRRDATRALTRRRKTKHGKQGL